MKPDDCTLTEMQYRVVREHARLSLLDAEAFGKFPTPVGQVMDAAKLIEGPADALDESFLKTLRRRHRNSVGYSKGL
jgi:hypothetical protein